MAQTTATGRLTYADVDRMPEDGVLRELVHGELREWMAPNHRHGFIVLRLGGMLDAFVTERDLGFALGGEVRFLVKGDPSHYRLADVAFVAKGKYPAGQLPPYETVATEPDLVVEIISPDDSATMLQEKVDDWFEAGTHLVWLVYPKLRHVVVFRPDGSAQTVREDGALDGGDVLPGLELPIRSFMP